MKQKSLIQTIKTGFLLGIGFTIPLAAIEFLSIKYSFYTMEQLADEYSESMYENAGEQIGSNEQESDTLTQEEFDKYNKSYVKDISLSAHETTKQQGQLLITGSFINKAKVAVNTVEIEAELFYQDNFVYECSSYINMSIEPEQSENYMIRCGCKDSETPEFDQIKVKVTRASSY